MFVCGTWFTYMHCIPLPHPSAALIYIYTYIFISSNPTLTTSTPIPLPLLPYLYSPINTPLLLLPYLYSPHYYSPHPYSPHPHPTPLLLHPLTPALISSTFFTAHPYSPLLPGISMFPDDGVQPCALLHDFTVWRCFDFGIFLETESSYIIDR